MVVASVIVTCLIGMIILIGNWQARRLTLTEPREVTQTILVMPDEVRTNGALVTFTGIDERDHQRETICYRARTRSELNRIRSINQPARWTVAGSLQPVLPATNEGQFDTQFYARQHRIFNEFRVSQLQRIDPVPVGSLRQFCHVGRCRLVNYFQTMPPPLNGYCCQLLVGDNNIANEELTGAVKRLGIIHLFCISGMHIILFSNLISLTGSYLWLERETIEKMLMVLLPLYLIIGGGSTSLIRAVIMAEVALASRHLKLSALDGWGISLLLGLIWNPYLLFNLGGQLSYLLALTLQVIEGQVSELKRCWWLGLLSLPAILYRVFEFHLLSLIASYVMIPAFSIFIFPSVVISAICYFWLPEIGDTVNLILAVSQRILSLLSQLPGEIHFGRPPLWVAMVLFLITLWLIERPSWLKYGCLLALYVSCFLFIHYPITGEVTFIDIGQGDSMIIRTPFNRRVMLIDTGGRLSFKQPHWAQSAIHHDLAERVSVNYLKSRGIRRIDTIYLSHHDADHIGYLPTFLKELAVKQIVVPAGMEKQPAFENKLNECHFQGRVIPATDRTRVDRVLQIVHPFAPGEAQNGDSLVLAGRFGGQNFLFTGDLDRPNERAVLAKYPELRADVLKLGHHGSKTASDPQFLQQLRVRRGIISAGRFNRYHHPNDEVIAELKQAGIIAMSTQQYGMIRYQYRQDHGQWVTTLKGDELRWTLPSSLNN